MVLMYKNKFIQRFKNPYVRVKKKILFEKMQNFWDENMKIAD